MRFHKRFCKAADGASALEFALVAPVFLAMVFGTIQMGIAFYYAGSVQFALEKTARILMVDQEMSEGELQAAFANELSTYTDQTIDVSYTVDSSGDVPIGQFAATYAHEVVIPFVPAFDVTFNIVTKVPLAND
jgi:Flp pilus assembly protein TadG